MKKIIIPGILIIFSAIFYSCYYDNMEYLYPEVNSVCDTTNVTFSVSITRMLQNNCWTCHSKSVAPSFGDNIVLQSYNDVSAWSDRIRGAINHENGFSAMPKNTASLDACTIRQYEIWLNSGKPNN